MLHRRVTCAVHGCFLYYYGPNRCSYELNCTGAIQRLAALLASVYASTEHISTKPPSYETLCANALQLCHASPVSADGSDRTPKHSTSLRAQLCPALPILQVDATSSSTVLCECITSIGCAVQLLKSFSVDEWRSSFHVTFLNEHGIDGGGLRRFGHNGPIRHQCS